ncbi:hypothetical protein CPC08DRAFT_767578 [Agrocybe pediades]|nr:hypothetical protein CPC08DRAFT_767578 [Agrocybe pediades]
MRNCEACMRVNKLEAEVEEAAEKLKQLIATLQNAKREMNYHHCSVVKKLPPELLSTIFESFVSDALSPTLPQDGGVFEALQHQVLPIPLILSNVCHRWREVAISTPRIWTILALSLDLSWRSPRADLARAWVSRTRNHALTVHIYSSLTSDYRSSSPDPSVFPILQILAAASGQWARFYFRIPISTLHYLGTHMQHTRLLETLAISLNSPLVHVPSFANPLWRAVTTLTVANIETEDCIKMVSCAPNLVTCHFEEIVATNLDEQSWHIGKPVIEHNKIQHFTYDSEESYYVFTRLKLPNLRRLRITCTCPYDDEDMSTVFPIFIKNSGLEKLEVLQLLDNFAPHDLDSALSTIPSIKDFRLTYSDNYFVIFLLEHLAKTALIDPSRAFLPNLTSSLKYIGQISDFHGPWYQRFFSIEPLIRLIRARTLRTNTIPVIALYRLLKFTWLTTTPIGRHS